MSDEAAEQLIDATSADPYRRTRSLLAISLTVLMLMFGGGVAAIRGWAAALEGRVVDTTVRVESLEAQRVGDDAETAAWRSAVLRSLDDIAEDMSLIKQAALRD